MTTVTNVSLAAILKSMGDAARKDLHDLVDDLPSAQIASARRALRRMKLTPEERTAHSKREIEILNAHADELKREMEDVLGYQADW